MTEPVRVSRWYFGGLASAGAACITHPLDLLKVQMQTQTKKISMVKLTGHVLKTQGIQGLYNGISASLLRQLTYSTARFGIYEVTKQQFQPKDGSSMPFYKSAMIAGVGGLAGGLCGTPGDLVNVRMQNDVRLKPEERRNYKHALDGVWRVAREEGVLRLWAGGTMACVRATLMTIGQLSFYDLAKEALLSTAYFSDNVVTHVSASLIAGGVATTMTQPCDVLKTRAMNAKPGEFKSIVHLFMFTLKEGPLAFYKGQKLITKNNIGGNVGSYGKWSTCAAPDENLPKDQHLTVLQACKIKCSHLFILNDNSMELVKGTE